MTTIRIYPDNAPTNLLFTTDDSQKIRQRLQDIGVQFEQWPTQPELQPGCAPEQVLAAYQDDIERLQQQHGYQAVDVISLDANHPDKAALRQKFLSEHTHSEDEVRFFAAGEGLFTLHQDGKVYEVHCVAGDLISVPANTPHWFDMGPHPRFVAIRWFTNPEGWVAQFTGSDIANLFNRLEENA
ncbi:acireductone dioxygenase [Bacterioplanes sanyensis]|uniref:1,2-dihydroxy-3-keto-5-methylthiopentene dioxygenase n=1 Tax=Bacterioplanes sanyensis TaxID=1249553 RepID=UPI00167549A2|nr:cupin domain-containing protein [Bacterioplanes sanyensis]GGY38682.1 acireductone dioxygenase [Bacterioplanes sanyensis]